MISFIIYQSPVVPGQAGGGSFRGERTIECAQGDQPLRCPNRIFCAHLASDVPFGGGVLVVASFAMVVM